MTIFELHLFGLHIAPTYYGLSYALAFYFSYIFVKKTGALTDDQLDTLTLLMLLGVVGGGRLGHVLFYGYPYFWQHPEEILQTWKGGMSFHGGLIGVILVCSYFCYKYRVHFLTLTDILARILPLGLGLGRFANYLNKELLGFHYTGPLAVEKSGQFFFPSPLLESFLEGVCLFFVVRFVYLHQKFSGQCGGAFLLFYGLFRFFVEYTKILEPQNAFLPFLTRGQELCIPMIIAGIYLLFFFQKYPLPAKK